MPQTGNRGPKRPRNKLRKLTNEKLALEMNNLWACNPVIPMMARWLALQGELERRHGQKGARKHINDDLKRRHNPNANL